MSRGYRQREFSKTLRCGFFVTGQTTVELAIAIPVLLLLVLVGADFGRVFYTTVGVKNAARAGAQYGSQTTITAGDFTGMIAAAKTDGSNFANLTATASQYTCATSSTVTTCPTSYCTNSPQATFIEVDTQYLFQTLMTYPGIPTSITLTGKAIMQVQQ
jgi:Flp pilus assembly protein TadG